MTNLKGYETDPALKWIYPHKELPPMGVKLAILTIGGIQITGTWRWDGGYVAWQRLFKRDPDLEVEYEEWLNVRNKNALDKA